MEDMKIQITETIVWDTESPENIEARQWIAENVTSQEATESDRYGRPTVWRTETEGAAVTVTREYVNPDSGSWARKRDVICVETIGNGTVGVEEEGGDA